MEKREKAREGRWEGEREEARPLPYSVWFPGRICGSVVLAKPRNDLGDFEGCCDDNSVKE